MKKIIISVAIIGLAAGITFGITNAWWTDEGTSTNWNIDKMTPGGTPYISTLYMRNKGSVNADYLKFTLANTPVPAGMDKRMRITELSYAGENLLTGGAGADLGSYVAPTNCTVTTSHINTAIGKATTGDVICVVPGTYTFSWEGGIVDVTKGVTIASTEGPGNTTISAGIKISADNVAVKGFKIVPSLVLGEESGVYLVPVLSNITVSDNMIEGQGSGRGVLLGLYASGAAYNSVNIENNVIHDLTTGIYTNSHTGIIDIKYNEIYSTGAGIGGLTGADVQFNKFHDNAEAVGADGTYAMAATTILQNNEFLAGDIVKNYDATITVKAENNWWGDFDPSDQVLGNVDYSPYAGGPFIGLINGNDHYKNGFADLDDFEHEIVIIENPDLLPKSSTYHTLKMGVQLDGPTTDNTFMGGTVGMDMTATMGQGPTK